VREIRVVEEKKDILVRFTENKPPKYSLERLTGLFVFR
jgi:hypothetical protein